MNGDGSQGEIPIKKKISLLMTSMGIQECLASETLVGCLSLILFLVETDSALYDERHPHNILSLHEWHKKEKYFEACLERQHHFMPLVFSVERVIWEDTKNETNKFNNSCIPSGIQNTRQNAGIYMPVYP